MASIAARVPSTLITEVEAWASVNETNAPKPSAASSS
jgi:hypothetical protein